MNSLYKERFAEIINKKGIVEPFFKHSKPTQKAIIQWMAIEGGAWFDLIPEDLHKLYDEGWSDEAWNLVIAEINKTKGLIEYTYIEIPTKILTDYIANEHEEISEEYDSWKDYHEWYLNGGDIPNHSVKDRWACILSGDEELISDGWHRLHCYIKNNNKTIPIVCQGMFK